ncbi:MAG: protein-L-isoaspartate O-methyltransferase family protein [Alphaproteobacteria bacterium]
MMNYAQARTNMVDGQIHPSGVIDPALLSAFETVPRELFVPEINRGVAYYDEEVSLGNDRVLIEPLILSKMLQELELKQSDVVLDIGGGSGYSAAILSSLVTTVVALEENETLLKQAQKIWNKIEACNIVGVEGKLKKGYSEQAPFDVIILNGAVSEIPQNICEQLAIGGKLITVLTKPDQTMGQVVLVKAIGESRFSSYTLFDASASYLPGFTPKTVFSF